jgi:hypothetical protein
MLTILIIALLILLLAGGGGYWKVISDVSALTRTQSTDAEQ